MVVVLGALDLQPVWKEQMAHAAWGVGTAAFGPDGTVYFNEYEARMAAATPSGTLLWEFEASGRLISLGLTIGRDETIYFSNEDEFYAVSKTGDLRWSIRLGSWGASSPVMAKSGAIYFASSFPNPRRTAVDTGLASSAHPWPLPRGDVRRSGRSSVLEPANGFSRTRQMTNQTMELSKTQLSTG